MTGVTIEIDLAGDGPGRLRELLDRIGDRRPLFEGAGLRLADGARARFRTETDIEGRPWTPLRPATIAARKRNKQLPLTILSSNTRGKTASPLRGSIFSDYDNDRLQVGSSGVPYAAAHQFGVDIQKKAGSRWMVGRRFARKADGGEGRDVAIRAHTIRIPARPFIGMSEGDADHILGLAEDWLTRL
jgi:phage gpG-like protein